MGAFRAFVEQYREDLLKCVALHDEMIRLVEHAVPGGVTIPDTTSPVVALQRAKDDAQRGADDMAKILRTFALAAEGDDEPTA